MRARQGQTGRDDPRHGSRRDYLRCWRGSRAQGNRASHRLAHADGYGSPREAHRGRSPKIKEFVPLAGLDDLVFTGWDIFEDNMYAAAPTPACSSATCSSKVKGRLSSIKPLKAVFDHNYVKKIDGPNVKKGKNKLDLAEQLRQDIRDFKKSSGAEPPDHHLVRLHRDPSLSRAPLIRA